MRLEIYELLYILSCHYLYEILLLNGPAILLKITGASLCRFTEKICFDSLYFHYYIILMMRISCQFNKLLVQCGGCFKVMYFGLHFIIFHLKYVIVFVLVSCQLLLILACLGVAVEI